MPKYTTTTHTIDIPEVPYEPPFTVDITRVSLNCSTCQKPQAFDISTYLWERGNKLRAEGGLMQQCFPTLAREERELLISGICNVCFDDITQ
jgi:hypothetical protein